MAPIPKELYTLRSRKEVVYAEFWRDAGVELFATFLFVTSQIGLTLNWGTVVDPLQVGIGSAFIWVALGYAFGHYGGAHMNPAITMAMVVRAEITIMKGMMYWTFQIVGGILGALFIYSITPKDNIGSLGHTDLGADVTVWQGVLIELWITLMLCMATMTAYTDEQKSAFLASLPAGFAIGFGSLVAWWSTGGSMNPARSVGAAVAYTALVDEDLSWNNHWIYWVGPMVGGLLAGCLIWLLELPKKTDISPTKKKVKSPQEPPRSPVLNGSVYTASRLPRFPTRAEQYNSSFDMH